MTNDLRELARHLFRVTTNTFPSGVPTENIATFQDVVIVPTLAGPNGESVRPDDAIERSRGIMIVAPPGGGKTTLLRLLATRQAEAFLAGRNPRCPVFVPARALQNPHGADLPALIAPVLAVQHGIAEPEALLRDSCERGVLSLFIDGLDEVVPNAKSTVFRVVQSARNLFPHLQLIVSARPSAIAGWPPGYLFFYIREFADESISGYVAQRSRKTPERAQQFLEAIRERTDLMRLARNPLLLALLWQTFDASGRIATSPAFLYADLSDFLLSTWDRQKGINHRSQLSVYELQRLLEQIANYQFEREAYTLTRNEAIRVISLDSGSSALDCSPDDVLDGLLTTGLLVEAAEHSLSFVHLSFQEFYTARALAVDPARLVNAIDKPNGHEIVLFACGMVQDVGPIVEAAVEKRLLLLAAKCISNGRLENQQLASYVVQEFRQEVGDRFLAMLARDFGRGGIAVDVHRDLLAEWRLVNQHGLSPNEKGRRLEGFAKKFFGQFFTVVSSNLNTEDGEIDIVLENKNVSPFWLEFGADILVECKNWNSHTPVSEIGAFTYKASHVRVRLAFFLAVSGFTTDAIRSMRNQAASAVGPLMVPIVGEDIERALSTSELLDEFLKERIREIKYLQKY